MRGLSDTIKRRCVFDYYHKRADIICIQESHSIIENEQIWQNEWGGQILFDHGESNARGVCVLVKKGFPGRISNVIYGGDGRSIIFDLEIEEIKYSIAAIYAPNTDSPKFFQNIDWLMTERSEFKMIVGDFNVVLNKDLDRSGESSKSKPNSKNMVIDLMSHYELCDVWRDRHPNVKEFSWFKNSNNTRCFTASRLDYILISKGLDQFVRNELYLPGIQTDHRAFIISIVNNRCLRGAGYWKLNNQILEEEEYKEIIRDEIIKVNNSMAGKSAVAIWEVLKTRIRSRSQSYCRKRKNVK